MVNTKLTDGSEWYLERSSGGARPVATAREGRAPSRPAAWNPPATTGRGPPIHSLGFEITSSEAIAKLGRDARPARPRSRGTRDPTYAAKMAVEVGVNVATVVHNGANVKVMNPMCVYPNTRDIRCHGRATMSSARRMGRGTRQTM